jgi:hypothetical protein
MNADLSVIVPIILLGITLVLSLRHIDEWEEYENNHKED